MDTNDSDDNEPYVLVEQRSSDIGPFLLGAALGATLALLLTPRSGSETRAVLRRQARAVRQTAEGVAGRVSDSFADARAELERRIESARAAVSTRTRQLGDAVAAGRSAAREAEQELKSELRQTAAGMSPKARPRRGPPEASPPGSGAKVARARRRPRGES